MSRFIKTVRKLDSFFKPKCFAHLYFPFASKDEIKFDFYKIYCNPIVKLI